MSLLKTATPAPVAYARLQDPDVIQICREGNADAFQVLLERYGSQVFNLTYRYLRDYEQAGDETQEIFFKVYRKLGLFRGQSSFKTWLYRVASNHCLNVLKRNRRRPGSPGTALSLDRAQAEGYQFQLVDVKALPPEEAYVRQEAIGAVRTLIDGLPLLQRQAMILCHYERMSYVDIAASLGMPINRLRSCLYRARQRLKRQLEERGDLLP